MRPEVAFARRQAYAMLDAAPPSRRRRRGRFGLALSAGPRFAGGAESYVLIFGAHGSAFAEHEVRGPSCHRRDQHGKDAVAQRLPVRQVEDACLEADLADDQRRRLGAHDIIVAHEVDADGVGADRRVRRNPRSVRNKRLPRNVISPGVSL